MYYLKIMLLLALASAAILPIATPDDFDGCHSSIRGIGDIDEDGTPDIILASRHYFPWPEALVKANKEANAAIPEIVWLISGKDLSPIRILYASEAAEGFGICMDNALDVNHDGVPDQIIGAHSDGIPDMGVSRSWLNDTIVISNGYGKVIRTLKKPGITRGHASVYSGKDGSLLYRFESHHTNDGFGAHVAGGGDLNHDGYADVIVGASCGYKRKLKILSRAYAYSGKDGSLLYLFVDPEGERPTESGAVASRCPVIRIKDFMGAPVDICPDMNEDGHDDILLSATCRLHVISGKDGTPILKLGNSPIKKNTDYLPAWVASPAGDLDGDGVEDVIEGYVHSCLHFYSGKTGRSYYYKHWYGGCLAAEASSVDALGDVNGDGYHDVVVGANETFKDSFDYGFAEVYSGKDGAVIHALHSDTDGIDVCCLGDMNEDGINDVGAVLFGKTQGLRILSGKDFKIIRRVELSELISKVPQEKLFRWKLPEDWSIPDRWQPTKKSEAVK